MRIAFVNVNAKATGGAEESLALLMRNLPPPFEPILVSFEDGPFAETMREAGIDVRIHEIAPAIRATRREGSWVGGALRTPIEILRLASTLKSLSPDLIHTDTLKGHVLGTVAGRLIGVPTMMHVRDMFDGDARSLLRFFATRLATDYVPVSRAVSRWYVMSESKVVYNPIDLEAYATLPTKSEARTALGLPLDVPIVGMIGRINRWKGHDRFLRIVANVSARRPIHGVIVGEARFRDYDFPKELERQVIALGIADFISFVPWLKDPRIAYAAVDVHVNCSTREPFGRTIVEAAACGVASVCFDDGALTEVADPDDLGIAVPAGNEHAFAEAISSLIDLLPYRQPIIRRIQRFSTQEHVAAMTQRMEGVVRKRLRDRGASSEGIS